MFSSSLNHQRRVSVSSFIGLLPDTSCFIVYPLAVKFTIPTARVLQVARFAGLAVVITDSTSRLRRVPVASSTKTINLNTFPFRLVKMASKLDQSLDDITKSRRQSGRNRRGGRSGASRAPVGGIRKNRANRGTTKPTTSTTTGSAAPLVDSKIIVSGLVRFSSSVIY